MPQITYTDDGYMQCHITHIRFHSDIAHTTLAKKGGKTVAVGMAFHGKPFSGTGPGAVTISWCTE